MYNEKKLKYGKASLEPYIDTHTMGLHYEKHYLTYLKNLNKILAKKKIDFELPKEKIFNHLEIFSEGEIEDLLFNLGGVVNHELYFSNINGEKKNKPTGILLNKINDTYGGYEAFKEKFTEIAMKLKGSGYTFLVMNEKGELDIINLSNQETPYLYRLYPIITLDLWEHAYYINYQNRKKDYIDNFFTIIDFESIEKRMG